ncbi:MAG: hypothetical protein CM15mP46_2220 [Alphaproteobacteria bacterium]|nr:MAG: hypothetical protein CM15mP46_2220 [Alphaproteobacteria bacterium]
MRNPPANALQRIAVCMKGEDWTRWKANGWKTPRKKPVPNKVLAILTGVGAPFPWHGEKAVAMN